MHRVAAVIALVLGCTSTVAPTPSTAERAPQPDAKPAATAPEATASAGQGSAKGPVAAPEVLDPPDWRCARDSDCVQTCALGAVSRVWLESHADRDTCDDGCNWQHDKVTCREGECVTLRDDGSIDERCSHRTAPR